MLFRLSCCIEAGAANCALFSSSMFTFWLTCALDDGQLGDSGILRSKVVKFVAEAPPAAESTDVMAASLRALAARQEAGGVHDRAFVFKFTQ